MDSPSDQTAPSTTTTTTTTTNVRRMSRDRLRRYVNDIIRIQNTPLREIILEHALLYLPAQPLLRLRSVSRSFLRRISSPFFSHVHSLSHRSASGFFFHAGPPDDAAPCYLALDPASDSVPDPTLSFVPDAPLTLLSSSNGLVAVGSGSRYYVCNPATMKCAALPRPPPPPRSGCACTLVYHPAPLNFSADFHLVCVTPKNPSLHVFSSASAAWRASNVRVPPPAAEGKWASVAVDGAAYWRAKDDSVVSYDPAADRLAVIEPPPLGAEGTTRWQLGEVGGKLCCVGGREGMLEVYELVAGDGAAWRKRTAVEVDGDPWPLICQGTDDRVVCWMDGMILRIDLRSRESRVMGIGVSEECVSGLPYISSLVAVKEFGSD